MCWASVTLHIKYYYCPLILSHSSEWSPLSLACLAAGRKQDVERFLCIPLCISGIQWCEAEQRKGSKTLLQEILNKSQEGTLSEEVNLADALRDKVELEKSVTSSLDTVLGKSAWIKQPILLAPCLTTSVSFSKHMMPLPLIPCRCLDSWKITLLLFSS